MMHMVRCTMNRHQYVYRSMVLNDNNNIYNSIYNNRYNKKSIHVYRGLLDNDRYHMDDICRIGKTYGMNVHVYMYDHTHTHTYNDDDIYIMYDYSMYTMHTHISNTKRCVWMNVVYNHMSMLYIYYRYVYMIQYRYYMHRALHIDDHVHHIDSLYDAWVDIESRCQYNIYHTDNMFIDHSYDHIVSSHTDIHLMDMFKRHRNDDHALNRILHSLCR